MGTRLFLAAIDDNKMPPKKKKTARVDQDSNLSWTDDEVELLLGVVRAYSFQKDYEGLQWESIKSKYEDISNEFVTMYEQHDGLPHDVGLFTRERIANSKDCKRKSTQILSSNRLQESAFRI